MPRPSRIRRKDLKRPDEFVTISAQVLAWAQSHQQQLTIAVVGVAIVIAGAAAFVSLRHARVRDANADLARALIAYRDAAKAGEAGNQLAEVGRRWSGTSVGDVAQLLAGSAELRHDNADSALVTFQGIETRDWPPYLKQQALLDLGYALDRKGQRPEAIGKYGEASALGGPYTFNALLAEARAQEAAGDATKARALYERIKRDFPDSPEKDLIESKLSASK